MLLRIWDLDIQDPAYTHILPFERTAVTYLEILPTPLIAAFLTGPMGLVTRGRDQILYLEPEKHSMDPDYPDAEVQFRGKV